MIVPDFWAEARRQHRADEKHGGRQVTVRRFGWSNASELDALVMAEARADEALRRILAGEKLGKREPKVPYNGAVGVPIREEVIARHGQQVITRNSYGARCLNSPDLLIADVDFARRPVSRKQWLAALGAMLAAAIVLHQVFGVGRRFELGMVVLALLFSSLLASLVQRLSIAVRGGARRLARSRIDAFATGHREWNLRIYETPAGLRLIATHRPFDAADDDVKTFFDAINVDPMYARMCLNQRCFRARLSAKPWRIGIATHMRPRPGTWPVRPERMGDRKAWIAEYEAAASAYAACRFVESVGSGVVDASIAPVIELHDRESRALAAGTRVA